MRPSPSRLLLLMLFGLSLLGLSLPQMLVAAWSCRRRWPGRCCPIRITQD